MRYRSIKEILIMSLPKNKSAFLSVLLIALLLFTSVSIRAELQPKDNFGIISRIIAAVLTSEHYLNKTNENEISQQLFNEYLETLDPYHLYFTQKDIDYFKKEAGPSLYNKLKQGNTEFAFIVYNTHMDKVKKREKFAKSLVKKGFDFNKDENFNFDRAEADWAKSEEELDDIWRKKIKNDVLTFRLMNKVADSADKKDKAKNDKPYLKKSPSERALKRLKTYRLYLEDNEPINVLEIYLSTLAHIYDPHSSYMSPQTEENFNIQMQLSFVGIGALLSSEDGYTKVEKIIPGGPAARDGQLKPTDRIIAVGEDDLPPIDILDMPLTKVVKKIRGKKGTNVHLTILEGAQGAQAIPKEILIERGVVNLKDSEASSKIKVINTPNSETLRIGVITLPSFYYDFQSAIQGKKDFKSSTKDVKKILQKFNKDGVDGVILDLRINGGGSLKEAIEITGLFIDDGPIVQTKNQRKKIFVEKDPDTKCYYNGPLLVLVSNLSASAAEILAGAIQDFGRGIIVGDKKTHGKGTVQTVLDLGNILSRFKLGFNPGAIKLTNAKFYRITGSSTQNKGITPDIAFDSFMDHMDIGEDKLKHALKWDTILPTQYTHNSDINRIMPELKNLSKLRQDKEPDFIRLKKSIKQFQEIQEKKEVSLNENKRWEKYLKEKKVTEKQKALYKSLESKIAKDSKSSETKTDEKDSQDLFLDESTNILADYIKLSKTPSNATAKRVTLNVTE